MAQNNNPIYNPIDVDNLVNGRAGSVRMADKAAAVQLLTARGWSSQAISEHLGITDRHVVRLRSAEVYPPQEVTFDYDWERGEDLADMADVAARFAAEMREDVESIWLELLNMQPQRMRELVMVLAAMVPDDQPISELLKWVTDLPLREAA